jgi:hypothetical protein
MNLDPDPVCSQRSDPDPVQIGPYPQHCFRGHWLSYKLHPLGYRYHHPGFKCHTLKFFTFWTTSFILMILWATYTTPKIKSHLLSYRCLSLEPQSPILKLQPSISQHLDALRRYLWTKSFIFWAKNMHHLPSTDSLTELYFLWVTSIILPATDILFWATDVTVCHRPQLFEM